jgi:uncharacterized protein YjbJ (UPF0337 family)
MDENRVHGEARNIGGKMQEGFGRAMGDAKTQAEGLANQVRGTAQDLYGQARDGATQMALDIEPAASSLEKALRNTIQTQPYLAICVALGVGWLLGRTTNRPL